MRIAIAGGGVAALEAALAARKHSPEAEITLYSREEVPPYRRPALSGMVARELDDARFYIKGREFYEVERIGLRLGAEVAKLELAERRLRFADGGAAEFDRLVISVGGRAFVPPVPGLETERAMVLREYSDLRRLRKLLSDGGLHRVTVLGGGVLGLELAAALLERKVAVTVVENLPNLMPRNLDPEAGKLVFAHLAEVPGLALRFGVSAVRLTDAGLELDDGTVLKTDLVCVSAGVRPNAGFAAEAGLSCGRGITVDEHMRVSGGENIFAAGDVAECNGVCRGLFSTARSMGQIAGTNAAGGDAVYVPEASPVRLAAFGLKVFSAGVFDGMRGEGGGDLAHYRKLFYNAEGELRGAILMGDLSEALKLQSAIGG